jgi:hypothetical protein
MLSIDNLSHTMVRYSQDEINFVLRFAENNQNIQVFCTFVVF